METRMWLVTCERLLAKELPSPLPGNNEREVRLCAASIVFSFYRTGSRHPRSNVISANETIAIVNAE